MDNVLELEAKVADLEKRIKFLYEMLEKQFEINDRMIKQVGSLQEKLFEYAIATDLNTQLLNMLNKL